MYETANATTTAMASEYTEDAPTGIKADAYLRDSERIVASLTDRPSEGAADYVAYVQAASDAELRVFEAISERPDRISSQSIGSLSISYNNAVAADLYDLVRDSMSRWLSTSAFDVPVVTVYE